MPPRLPLLDDKWVAMASKLKLFPVASCPQARKVGEKLAELNLGFDPNLKHHLRVVLAGRVQVLLDQFAPTPRFSAACCARISLTYSAPTP